MKLKRTNISLPESLFRAAEQLMREQHFSDFSGFVQHLIREESKRCNRAFQERADALRHTIESPNIPPFERVAARAALNELNASHAAALNEPAAPYHTPKA